MSCIAIITARGGSKRIPKKNIRDFCGKPIIAYSIEAALQANIFDEVMVSTDSEEIADVGKRYGAEVPFMRSEVTSNDFAGTDDVLLEVLGKYSELGKSFETMCCIYPTAPFVTKRKLNDAYRIMVDKKSKMVMPVVAYSYPPQRSMVVDQEGGRLKYLFPEKYEFRSQDLEKWYHDAGQFYYYDVNEFIMNKGRIIEGICPIIIPELEVQDIDNEDDWKLAEIKYKMILKDKSQ